MTTTQYKHLQPKDRVTIASLKQQGRSMRAIAHTLGRMWPDDPSMQVSHETIYTAIYAHAGGELRRQLIACLR